MIYFDNAATTGTKPKSVISAVNHALTQMSANPGRSGHPLSENAAAAMYAVREKTANFFGADGPENVVFTPNCTYAINYVLKGVLKKGDHAVVSGLEHNAVMRPLYKVCPMHTVFPVSENDEETLAAFRESLKPNTRLVFSTAASNVTGKILPIGRMGRICREKGILFAVDGAQAAGVIPLNMKEMQIDYLCLAPHKGLYAPMGTGILIARKELPATVIEGGTGTNSAEMTQPEALPERLESGTQNLPGILGVGAGIDFVTQKGIGTIYRHELLLIQRLYRGLSTMPQVLLYTPFPRDGSFVPVLSFNIRGMSSEQTAELLSESGFAVRGGLHCAPFAHRALKTLDTGAVRVSVSAFNRPSHIDLFLKVIQSKNFVYSQKKH